MQSSGLQIRRTMAGIGFGRMLTGWLWISVAVALLLAACGARPALVLVDQAGVLDRAALETAAAPLLAREASVTLILVEQGGAEDFADRLAAAGQLRDGRIVPRGIAIYVSLNPRYDEVRVGEPWNAALSDETLEQLRREQLNPALAGGRFNEGLTLTLKALDARIVSYERQTARLNWILLAAGALVVMVIILLLFGKTLMGTPPFRALAWLWAQTPPGRRQERRRREQDQAGALRWLEHEANTARQHFAELAGRAGALAGNLEQLDQRRVALLQRAPADEQLLQSTRELQTAYRQLSEQLNRLAMLFALLGSAALETRTKIDRARAAFDKPQQPRKKRGKVATVAPIDSSARSQLADLYDRLDRLDEAHAALARQSYNFDELTGRVKALQNEYYALSNEGLALWKKVAPYDYAREQRLRRADSALATLGRSSSTPDYTYGASSSTSSATSYDDWSSSTSLAGESRAGGDW